MAHEKVKAKLAELGLELPVAAAPVAAYLPAIKNDKLVFTAGQLPTVDGAISKVGKVLNSIGVTELTRLSVH